jgi:hypothetical protein
MIKNRAIYGFDNNTLFHGKPSKCYAFLRDLDRTMVMKEIIMKSEKSVWLILTLVVVAIFLGLRPRAWFIVNDLQRLPDERGICFCGSGIAFAEDLRLDGRLSNQGPFTIDMAVTPERTEMPGS